MPVDIKQLYSNYQSVSESIAKYAQRHGRKISDVKLIAVSKRHTADKVLTLLDKGHTEFAENYLQEGLEKIAWVKSQIETLGLAQKPTWHFIGHIQSRKCKLIAEHFDWVHTIDSQKVAQKLNQHRVGMKPLNVLIQLNLENEHSKSGVTLSQLEMLSQLVANMGNLKLAGLMIIPTVQHNFDKQRAIFAACKRALDQLNHQGFRLNQLSMGMSNDLEAAIAEGATQVRIGTALFGKRPN